MELAENWSNLVSEDIVVGDVIHFDQFAETILSVEFSNMVDAVKSLVFHVGIKLFSFAERVVDVADGRFVIDGGFGVRVGRSLLL